MQMLPLDASRSRYETWLSEIFASLSSHRQHNYLLADMQKQRLADEERTLRPYAERLFDADDAYRKFLKLTLVQSRADRRVADYLCDVAVRHTEGAVRPHREALSRHVPGGFSKILGGLPLSRVLRAGAERTSRLVLSAADILRHLPESFDFAPAAARQLQRAGSLLAGFVESGRRLDAERRPLQLTLHRAKVDLREALELMNARLRQDFDQEFIESLYPALRRSRIADPDDDVEQPIDDEAVETE